MRIIFLVLYTTAVCGSISLGLSSSWTSTILAYCVNMVSCIHGDSTSSRGFRNWKDKASINNICVASFGEHTCNFVTYFNKTGAWPSLSPPPPTSRMLDSGKGLPMSTALLSYWVSVVQPGSYRVTRDWLPVVTSLCHSAVVSLRGANVSR